MKQLFIAAALKSTEEFHHTFVMNNEWVSPIITASKATHNYNYTFSNVLSQITFAQCLISPSHLRHCRPFGDENGTFSILLCFFTSECVGWVLCLRNYYHTLRRIIRVTAKHFVSESWLPSESDEMESRPLKLPLRFPTETASGCIPRGILKRERCEKRPQALS